MLVFGKDSQQAFQFCLQIANEIPEKAVSVPEELVPDLEKDISKPLPTDSEIWLNHDSRFAPITSGTLGQAVLPGNGCHASGKKIFEGENGG